MVFKILTCVLLFSAVVFASPMTPDEGPGLAIHNFKTTRLPFPGPPGSTGMEVITENGERPLNKILNSIVDFLANLLKGTTNATFRTFLSIFKSAVESFASLLSLKGDEINSILKGILSGSQGSVAGIGLTVETITGFLNYGVKIFQEFAQGSVGLGSAAFSAIVSEVFQIFVRIIQQIVNYIVQAIPTIISQFQNIV